MNILILYENSTACSCSTLQLLATLNYIIIDLNLEISQQFCFCLLHNSNNACCTITTSTTAGTSVASSIAFLIIATANTKSLRATHELYVGYLYYK